MNFCNIRSINKTDVPFVWNMLYEIRCARSVREGKVQPSKEILKTPELAKYVQGWGRTGDVGFIAISTDNQSPIGTAWYLL